MFYSVVRGELGFLCYIFEYRLIALYLYKLVKPFVNRLFDRHPHFGIAELSLRLSFEFHARHLDGKNGCKPLLYVVGNKRCFLGF